jgi:hypothetical protein
VSALYRHNEAWGELMNQYWQDFLESRASSISEWKVADRDGIMRTMDFENWVTQGSWHKKFDTNTGISSPVIRDAAEETYGLVLSMTKSFGTLAGDIATLVFGSSGSIVEQLRSIITNWLAPYFPAFAMKEKQRAVYLNQQSKQFAQTVLPGYEASAQQALRDIGYAGDLASFKSVMSAVEQGDIRAIPHQIDLKKMQDRLVTFSNYYHATDVLSKIGAEEQKIGKDMNYVPVYIPATEASMATSAGAQALVWQYRLKSGAVKQSGEVHPLIEDTQVTAGDKMKQLWLEVLSIPNLLGTLFETSNAESPARIGRSISRGIAAPETLERRIAQSSTQIAEWRELHSRVRDTTLLEQGESLYAQIEQDYRHLVDVYNNEGNVEAAVRTLGRLRTFYAGYAQELKGRTVEEQNKINTFKDIAAGRPGNRIVNPQAHADAGKIYHADSMVRLMDDYLGWLRRTQEYVSEYTGIDAAGVAQQRLTHGVTATGFYGAVVNALEKQVGTDRPAELQDMYSWIAANSGHTIHIDAFDERSNRVTKDIVINFMLDGKVEKAVQVADIDGYGLKRDVRIRQGEPIVSAIAAALEAPASTPQGGK